MDRSTRLLRPRKRVRYNYASDEDIQCEDERALHKRQKIVTTATAVAPSAPLAQPWNKWLPWPSTRIPYKKSNGVGPGEYRIASLLNTVPLGQNAPYDFNLNIPGLNPRGEVKETDAGNSFKTGRDGRNAWRPIHVQVILFQEVLISLMATNAALDDIVPLIQELIAMSPDEICERNIYKISIVCEALYDLKTSMQQSIRMYTIYDIFTGMPVEVSGSVVYNVQQAQQVTQSHTLQLKDKLQDDYPKAHLIHILQHPYIDDPSLFQQQLNSLAETLFHDLTIILVNQKGYFIMTEPAKQLMCNRITMGVPRFKGTF